MANTKISALTSATTPLAGTETLPVVQSSATTQVSVANLTAGRAVSATSYAVTGSTAPANGMYLYAANSLGWSISSTQTLWLNSTGLGFGNPPNYSFTSYKAGAVANYIQVACGSTGAGAGNGTLFGVDASGNGTISAQGVVSLNINVAGLETFNLDSSNNAKFSRGNLVQGTAAKGINFTANTPYSGKTTQLLSLYEEGTWSPSITGLTYVGTPSVEGQYTIIGNIAYMRIQVSGSVSVASTGTVYVPIPFATIARNSVLSTVTSATLDLPNGRLSTNGYGYLPNFAATSDAVIFAGWFMTR